MFLAISNCIIGKNIYDYVSYYRPLVMIGHHDYPWHELKSILFPVVGDIKKLNKQRKQEKVERLECCYSLT